MPRMQFRIKPGQFAEKRDYIISKDDVNVVTLTGIPYFGKITKMDSVDIILLDKRSQKHFLKVADLSEIVAENFV